MDGRLRLPYRPPLRARESCEVLVVGAGLVGLTLAIDLTLAGIDVILIEKGDRVSEGSRSICQAQRSLEVWDRLGVGEAIRDRGVTWSTGRVFHRDREVYAFDLTREPDSRMPPFVNLQQYAVEALLHDRLSQLGGRARACHELTDVRILSDAVEAGIATPDGPVRFRADWLVSCEGVRSTARRILGLSFAGETFADRFLIADVRMRGDFPNERWFWFEPPFHDGQTALLHRQADDIWRIDLQLGPDADPELERDEGRVRQRLVAMLGHDRFRFEWISIYQFQCRTLSSYLHDRVIFAGDSAHQVSPFGARGGNGGVGDADNLGWKLARVVRGQSPPSLLQSYDLERREAADANIGHSTRATDFMVPRSPRSRRLRDSILDLAAGDPFARRLINAGRLSTAHAYASSPLSTADQGDWPPHVPPPGAPLADLGVGNSALHLSQLIGGRLALLACDPTPEVKQVAAASSRDLALVPLHGADQACARLRDRYGLTAGDAILFRPDQHVAARLRAVTLPALEAARNRAAGLPVS